MLISASQAVAVVAVAVVVAVQLVVSVRQGKEVVMAAMAVTVLMGEPQ